jgi:enoyl-CoA hydratase
MTFETIRYDVDDRVARLTLARPDKRNPMNADMFRELGVAAEQAAADDSIHAVLVSGDGPTFCAGIDLSALAGLGGTQGAPFRAFVKMAQRPFRALATMPKPVVAAVQGHAIGAGFQLALAADLRVASTDAKFGMLEGRYGLIPDLGGPHRLARLIGPARAKELIWTTRLVEADEAERIGLVNRLADSEPLKAAEALLEELLTISPVPVAFTKALIDRAPETSLEVEFEREQDVQGLTIASEDHREAVAAFLEQRPPKYSGR